MLEVQQNDVSETATESTALVVSSHGSTVASHDAIVRVGKAFTSSNAAIDQAQAAWDRARSTQIAKLRAACEGISPVTEEMFEQTWRPTLETSLADKYSNKGSLSTAISHLKVAVIAFTNGIEPDAEDTTFTKFVVSAREKVRANGLMKEGKGRKAGSGEAKVVKKVSARDQALRNLAIDAKGLDETEIRSRVAALDYILREHGWSSLVEYAKELQAD